MSQQPDNLLKNLFPTNLDIKKEYSLKKVPIKINLRKDKFSELEENFYKLELPFATEFKWLLRIYGDVLEVYQKLKVFKTSLTSYNLVANDYMNFRMYFMNFKDPRNINNYEIILEMQIKITE